MALSVPAFFFTSSQSLTHVQGVVQHMCTEPSGGCWVLTGSSRGQMALWDMRFQLQVGQGLVHPSAAFKTQPWLVKASFGTCCVSSR